MTVSHQRRSNAARPLKPIFISYSHRNQQPVTELANQFRARGVPIWRDIDRLDLGSLLDDEIRVAIQRDVSGALMYWTPESLASDYVLTKELPAFIDRHIREPRFPIIPVLDGVTFEQVNAVTSALELSKFIGIQLPAHDAAARTAQMIEAARRLLERILPPRLERWPGDQPLPLNLFSYPPAGAPPSPLLTLDWQPLLTSPPSTATWQTQLLPALHDLRRVIGNSPVRRLNLFAKAHLSLGYSFGYQFRAPTDITLAVQQGDAWWSSADRAGADTPLLETSAALDRGPDVSIELSLTPNNDASVLAAECIDRLALPIRARIHLQLPVPASVIDSTHAAAIVAQIRAAFGRARNVHQAQTIHLFGTMPFAVAVLLGRALNACEPVQCYEYDRRSNSYTPSCRLELDP
jgi:hypothetical protein